MAFLRSVNSTNGASACPVRRPRKTLPNAIPVVIASVALLACGTDAPEDGTGRSVMTEGPVLVQPDRTCGFAIVPAPWETVALRWSGEGAGTVESVTVSPDDAVMPGDTLCTVVKEIGTVLRERLEMELEMAEARLSASPADSLLLVRVDSLTRLMDSLETGGPEPFISPLEGILVDVQVLPGDRVTPGRVLATLSVASRELYTVHPPEGFMVHHWPDGASTAEFVEEHPGYAVYSGEEGSVDSLFLGMITVERIAVFESGMRSYLITEYDDTVSVLRVGEDGGGRIMVLPASEIAGRLRTWTGD